MNKILRLAVCVLFVVGASIFIACSDDDEGEAVTSNVVALAIAEIKASNTSYLGVNDFTALTFSGFSNKTNDPIYQYIAESESATGEKYRVLLNDSTEIKKDNRYILKTGLSKATLDGNSVACWSTPREDRPVGLGAIRVVFKTDGLESVRRICASGSWIDELPTSGTINLNDVKDFVAVKATGAGIVSASITNYSCKTDAAVAALVNEKGTILNAITLTEQTDEVTPSAQSISATVSAGEVVMLVVSKNGTSVGSGTININALTFVATSNSGTVVGTYKGVITMNETLYMIFTIKDDNTWVSQGYTDNTYTTTTLHGTIKSGTYVQSGNTITLSGTTYGNANITGMICTTNDNWNTVTFSGVCTGTATKQ